MAVYSLYYFNLCGLGEPIRYLLHYAGIKFDDNRFEIEDWPKWKPKTPMGQVPLLEIDGKPYHQSRSLCRFLGKKLNLYGDHEKEALEIDATADTIDDMRLPFTAFYWEDDPAFKAKLKEGAFKKMEFLMGKLEEQVKNNGGFFVGGKISWVDFYYSGLEDYLTKIVGYDFSKDYPAIKKITEIVREHPRVKAYIETRPKTAL